MKTSTKKIKVKKESGGSRIGAGRPIGAKHVNLTFRVLPEWKDQIKIIVRSEIQRIKTETLAVGDIIK